MKLCKQILSLLLMAALLAGCGKQPEQPEQTQATTEQTMVPTQPTVPTVEQVPPENGFELLGSEPVSIVYEYGFVDQLVYECKQLGIQITMEGYEPVEIYNDWEEDEKKVVHDAREILVGNTNRKASRELVESLEDGSFAVKVTENQVLLAGKDQMATHYAIRYFRDEVLKSAQRYTAEGTYQIPAVDYVGEVPDMTLKEMAATGEPIVQICYEVGRLDGIEGHNRVEGGCSDGTYIYQSHDTADLSQIIISKTEIATMKRVAVSEPMDVATADDMTWHNGELILCKPGNRSTPEVAVVDAETLEFKEYRKFTGDHNVSTCHYESAKDQYVARVAGTNLAIYDSQMNFVKLMQPGDTVENMTGQGMIATEEYIFCNWWDELRREQVHDAISVYDWDGNFIAYTTAYWDNGMADMEPKTLYNINGELYGMWIDWAQGMFVFRIEFALA